MDSQTSHAVFLSYAREDAASALRIAEALRSHGIEVWFDQSELRGGDAWDEAIRSQIKACALFLPLISRHSDGRLEGYFRLEWRLADQRTHLMAKGRPFLVPVVVDDTPDVQARVPDSFLEVQWTRLPGGETPPAFASRVASLLAGSEAAPAPNGAIAPRHETRPARPSRPMAIALAVVLVVALAAVLTLAVRSARKPAASPSASSASSGPLVRASTMLEAPGATVEDFRVAEEMIRTELAKHPDDPDAVLAMARVCNGYLNRGFDTSESRLDQSRHYSELAMQLAPERTESLAERAQSLALSRTDFSRAEQLIQQAIALAPNEPRYRRILDYDVLAQGPGGDRAVKSAERTAADFPKDVLCRYQLSLIYRNHGMLDESERATRETVAIYPITSAVDWQARFLLWRHGDLEGATQVLGRVPAVLQTDPRVVLEYLQCACLSRDPATIETALDAVGRMPGAWVEDFIYTGPKALLMGELYRAQGKIDAAHVMFSRARTEIGPHEANDPSFAVARAKCWTLLELGEKEEPQFLARAYAQQNSSLPTGSLFYPWWLASIPMEFLVGNPAPALKWMADMAARPGGHDYLRTAFQLDRRMAPFRADPRIVALLGAFPSDPGRNHFGDGKGSVRVTVAP